MTPEKQRNHAGKVAKSDTEEALVIARAIDDPWFKSQALSWVARFAKKDTIGIAAEAGEAAAHGNDAYKRTAARTWEIAALAEREFIAEAREALAGALEASKDVEPQSSRAEALMLLLHAALRIDHDAAELVATELQAACGDDLFWRCKRAIKDSAALLSGEYKPRKFFW